MNSMKPDFSELLAHVPALGTDAMNRLEVKDAPIGVFYGKRSFAPCLAFLTKKEPLSIKPTRYISVDQWKESDGAYWTYFMLQSEDALTQFIWLANDLIAAAIGKKDEHDALMAIKNSFHRWRLLFQSSREQMPLEAYMGLFGELYIINCVLQRKYGVAVAIEAWSGPEATAKDFSVGEDWYEAKTVSVNKTAVGISSLVQLESEVPGTLCVVRVERMSDQFDNGMCTVAQLIDRIIGAIETEEIKEKFLNKVEAYGYSVQAGAEPRLNVASCSYYAVVDGFPRLTTKSVPFKEIVGVSYQLDLGMLRKFKKEIQ